MLALDQLEISRIIVHHIPGSVNKETATPSCSNELLALPPAGLDMFSKRLAKSLGHSSKGIRVDIQNTDAHGFFQRAAQMMLATETVEDFIATSKVFAQLLCDAQGIKALVESKLLVMSGVTGEFQRPFVAVVKADMQDALAELPADGGATISYLENIFLTEAQRLFKIGFLQQNVARPRINDGLRNIEDYTIHLFDHLLTSTETRNAAHYFYAGFLGTDVAASDRRLTQDFYEKTLRFFESRNYDADELIEKGETLRSELRSNDATISTSDFAQKYLEPAEADDYEQYMRNQAFPAHAIVKDTEYVKNKIKRRRKLVFSSKVIITTPSDGEDLVMVEEAKDDTTIVTISGKLTKSE
ncbi:nucleoid-associated protein [Pusillimonas sp. DMV24BSW_D]|uniref:nucleoid-associated protein n=1 Tax=Neopusillimonas aestuarii TaxID=2716226 RepID=UPI00140AD7F7|nr:nucleoid-associated protein [Pusillimonas sp. DMV24BSW_D]QIM48991.1 nucleoid-associated protein [Pusillimonas sp. DMV24BSW_D]